MYVVNGMDAVASLEHDFFTTAHVYKQYNPDYASTMLFFDCGSSKIVDFAVPEEGTNIV